MVQKLASELNSFKTESKHAVKGLEEAVKLLETKLGNNAKYLTSLVKSNRHQVLHKNSKTLVYMHPSLWKTLCGWNYYGSAYEFAEGDDTKVTCSKCVAAAQSKEVDKSA